MRPKGELKTRRVASATLTRAKAEKKIQQMPQTHHFYRFRWYDEQTETNQRINFFYYPGAGSQTIGVSRPAGGGHHELACPGLNPGIPANLW